MEPSKKKQACISAFLKLGGPASISSIKTWQHKPANLSESFEYKFMGHTGMWSLADRYAIASLKDLACSYLVRELAQWTTSASAFIPNFGRLVRHVYGSLGGRQLQLLVVQFAACLIEDVSGLEGWSTLLKDVPDFAADLIHQMTNRFD